MRFQPLMVTAVLLASAPLAHAAPDPFRPPAVPLLTSDPFFSVWSMSDTLNGAPTRHWTQREMPLTSLIRIDGKTYRLIGTSPRALPGFPQTEVKVLPTRTVYEFEDTGVHVSLTFMTPSLPQDIDVLSRPVTYLTWDVRTVDGKTHDISLFDSMSALLAVNEPKQPVTWSREAMGPLTAQKIGSVTQKQLGVSGDDARRDWGYACLVAPTVEAQSAAGSERQLTSAFVTTGAIPTAKANELMPRPANEDSPTLAVSFALGKVGSEAVSRHALLGYDEQYSIRYFGQNLQPYWRRNGMTLSALFQAAEREYPTLTTRCTAFDRELMTDATKAGGAKYAQMIALAYRQCLAANGLAADANGKPLMFTKENNSNGDIATVDVIFPQDPMLILLSPTLAKASIVPAIAYGSSPRWKFPNAPHDLGTYPIARGTDDGGEQMPVEESGNILILCDAIAQSEGNGNWVTPWWPHLSQWAQYLEQYGQDPEDQLCTDDFMGHLAHNSNLSIKAIVALAAYADLCKMRGETANAAKYHTLALGFAKHWVQVADNGDASLLAFDKPNTWGMKYNLIWDKILGLNVFPASVARKEVAYYKTQMQPYGLPLDSRTRTTKSDWTVWSATLAENQADFEALTDPMYDYLDQTSARRPFSDWYATDDVNSVMFNARGVVGGIFIKMLADPALRKKWTGRDKTVVSGWAPLPVAPKVTVVVPTSQTQGFTWHYTTHMPPANWTKPGFDDSGWKSGEAPFGTLGNSRTTWNDTPGDIWIRRSITLPATQAKNLQFNIFHDEDTEIYVDGTLAAEAADYNNGYEPVEITPAALALLKPGATVTLSVHVRQTRGGQIIDIGLVDIIPSVPDAK